MFHEQDEKGIRCKTGAVPAAVNPICTLTDCVVELEKPLFPKKREWEGINKRDKPEDLP